MKIEITIHVSIFLSQWRINMVHQKAIKTFISQEKETMRTIVTKIICPKTQDKYQFRKDSHLLRSLWIFNNIELC